jgi:hypothetical protein
MKAASQKTLLSVHGTPGRQSRAKREEISRGLTEALDATRFAYRPFFERKERARAAKPARIIAYDFETTRIAVGTPAPLYLTAYAPDFHFDGAIESMAHLTRILTTRFLIDATKGAKFVAWNGNRFDAYFVAAALIREKQFELRPYMTRGKALRGLRVTLLCDESGNPYDPKSAPSWEFLDGIAMLGTVGVKLEKLLLNFAPDHAKLTGVIDFEREEFDPNNPDHRAYAMRDSVGLWHAMDHAQRIMLRTFNQPLAVTMGGACIKIFQANIPRGVQIEAPIVEVEKLIREQVLRGGFCYCARRYAGPIWKYDLNQAYAAAMRESKMPAGGALHIQGAPRLLDGCYIARITARKRDNNVPFYCRTAQGGRVKSVFALDSIPETWITSIEYRQLLSEGWQIKCAEHWRWGGEFTMQEYVDKLEVLRTTCDGGPSGPIGTMIKATGNHSYGKTLEFIEPIEHILAYECPPDCLPFYDNGIEPLDHVFYRFDLNRRAKEYHQPQIGAFITAHVRMVLRRAILIAPDAWLYADTDCVVFDRDLTDKLDIDGKRYGAWKIEESGTPFRIIAKKVYAEIDGDKRSAKGMNVKRLSADDFARWFEGDEPVQDQLQINNFLSVVVGAEMYRKQTRRGTAIEKRA